MAPPQQQIPIFVISLARATERREKVCTHLNLLGLTYRLFEGIDGNSLPQAERRQLVAGSGEYHPGVVGCYMSHVGVYRILVDEAIDVALVLEDDARLHPRVKPLLQAGCTGTHFDYCFLDSDDHNDLGPVYFDRDGSVELGAGIRAHQLSAGPATLHAYMISLRAAAKRVEHAWPIVKPIDLYDHLPYPLVFRAVISPKLAWVSPESLVSFTSLRNESTDRIRFAWLRRSPLFYRLRDALMLKGIRRLLLRKKLIEAGRLAPGHRWAPLPAGREVVF